MTLKQFQFEPWQVAMLGWLGMGISPGLPMSLMVPAAAIGYLWRDATAWTRHAKLQLYALLVAAVAMAIGFATNTVAFQFVSIWLINAGASGIAFCLFQLRKAT